MDFHGPLDHQVGSDVSSYFGYVVAIYHVQCYAGCTNGCDLSESTGPVVKFQGPRWQKSSGARASHRLIHVVDGSSSQILIHVLIDHQSYTAVNIAIENRRRENRFQNHQVDWWISQAIPGGF